MRVDLHWTTGPLMLRAVMMLGAAFVPLAAQPYPHFQTQLKRIFQDKEFDYTEPRNFRWLPNSESFSVVQPEDDSAIQVCDSRSGQCREKINARVPIESYEWSPDATSILVFTHSVRNWASDTPTYARKGDYWVVDRKAGTSRRIAADAKPSTLMLAKFSPDSRHVGYVRDSDLYVEEVATSRVQRLTRDGSSTLLNGRSDWVYEEELSLGDGFRWSPDSKRIAFLQFDISPEGTFTLINDTETLYPRTVLYPYPIAGTPNARVKLGVVDVQNGDTTWTGVEVDPGGSYLARFAWTDTAHLSVLRLNRRQNVAEFLVADPAARTSRVVYRDSSGRWIDVVDPIWLDGGKTLLWMTEKDGWRRVCRVDTSAGSATVITRFDADVAEIAGVDSSQGILYFTASPSSSIERYLYRAKLDGRGAPERVSPAGQAGTHQYQLSPDAKWALHSFSRFDTAPVYDVIRMSDHGVIQTLAGNREVQAKLSSFLQPSVEFFQVEAAPGVQLDGWMMLPKDFDRSRKYPMVVYVYGEPWSQTVLQDWGNVRRARYTLFHRALADLGFIVMSVDPRGTPALKGTKWRQDIGSAIGPLAAQDIARAVENLIHERTYIDGDRVGVWGRSGGGTTTLNLMFRYPELFKVGVAVAAVPDQMLYDTIYQEKYMGRPADNPEGYAQSAIHFAEGLRGRLLLIHGTGDDNVHIQGAERLVNRLIELGKPVDLMFYPNRSHFLSEGNGTTYHQHMMMGRYLYEHLKPE
jgi:dipeptidyl-peptidase-4